MLSIIILDNYPILRFGINNLLKNHFKDIQISEISSVNNFPQLDDKLIPDLVILGINDNSEKEDLKLYHEVKQFFPETPIIIYDEVIYNFKTLPYLEFGIEGYLLKHNDPSEFIRCVEIVLDGKRYVCNEVLQNLFNRFLLEKSTLTRKQLLHNLRNSV